MHGRVANRRPCRTPLDSSRHTLPSRHDEMERKKAAQSWRENNLTSDVMIGEEWGQEEYRGKSSSRMAAFMRLRSSVPSWPGVAANQHGFRSIAYSCSIWHLVSIWLFFLATRAPPALGARRAAVRSDEGCRQQHTRGSGATNGKPYPVLAGTSLLQRCNGDVFLQFEQSPARLCPRFEENWESESTVSPCLVCVRVRAFCWRSEREKGRQGFEKRRAWMGHTKAHRDPHNAEHSSFEWMHKQLLYPLSMCA